MYPWSHLCEKEPKMFQLLPGQCVVSEWTEWGTCPTVCFKRDRLPLVYRNRTILALGTNDTGTHLLGTRDSGMPRTARVTPPCFKFVKNFSLLGTCARCCYQWINQVIQDHKKSNKFNFLVSTTWEFLSCFRFNLIE